jgi:hypothetical protein
MQDSSESTPNVTTVKELLPWKQYWQSFVTQAGTKIDESEAISVKTHLLMNERWEFASNATVVRRDN